ncbi:Valine--tRNA ligase, mitochondrial 1 [Glycine soja]|uniref:valine--tRNA ligase n=1 Tax=Glycine soja TaxID=3848 RepID=A0A445F5F5_GLYSO|nr:Valine--tRNA ligase, mitochondrial 1 [Glycine soja]
MVGSPNTCMDPDVLDTWFSAGLFPLSVLGWPDDTEDLKTFYPTSVLETGHDIIFFWVARMVMQGLKLGGDVPFTKIYLHPMVRDAHGRKMSKSLGNVVDPIEVINGISLEGLHKRLEAGNLDPKELAIAIEGQKKDFPNGIDECGVDALRFALVSYTAQSDKINLDIQRVVGYRQWCNKLWNAVRFAMSKLGDDYIPPANLIPDVLPFSCKWILSVLNKTIFKTVKSLESFEFSQATTAVYSWWQYQLCDRLPSTRECERAESIMICDYPSTVEGWNNEKVENDMDIIESTVKSLRSIAKESCDSHQLDIATLANLSSLTVITEKDAVSSGYADAVVNENLSVYLEFQGANSAEAEGKIKKIDELQKQIERLEKMMNAKGYEEKVLPNIREKNQEKLDSLKLLLKEMAGLTL